MSSDLPLSVKEMRVCKECGKEFVARRRDQVYHSKRCKWRAAHKRTPTRGRQRPSRAKYMREYRKSPVALAAQRECQRRYRQRPEVCSRRRNYYKEYRQCPGARSRKRQCDRNQRERQERERLQADFLRLRSVLAEKLEMTALIIAKENLTTQLRAMSTEQLKQELTDRLGLTAESLLRTACLVALLEERGEDLSGLRIGLIDHLRKIALGTLLPEIVVRFAGNGRMIRRIGELGIVEQRRILAGERPEDVLKLEAGPFKHVGGSGKTQAVRDREEEKLSEAQRPESVVPKGSARDVAEYLFRLVLTNDDPAGVMGQLERLFAEYKAGGKRQRLVLESVEE